MLKLKNGFVVKEIAGETIVMPMQDELGDKIITLSESAAIIWKKLEKGAEPDELVSALLDEYEIDEPTARADVLELIDQLKAQDYLA